MGTGDFNAGDKPAICWHPKQGGGGGRNTPSRFMLKKPEISVGVMGQLVRMQTLPTFHSVFNSSTGYSLRVTQNETTGNDKLSCSVVFCH